MKPTELVVEQKYDVKIGRKNARRGDDGFAVCIYLGTNGDKSVDGKGVSNEVYLFREADTEAIGYSVDPWEVYVEDLAKKVRQ